MESVSACPYLDRTQTKCRLEFALASKIFPGDPEPHFPFLELNSSDPFARIIEGQFVTDAEGQIRRVFVLLQRDDYSFVADELWPFSNPDVDQYWRQALLLHRDDVRADSTFLLSHQIGRDGTLLPFKSLFYCQLRRVFFHPACPRCGRSLELCYDDERLSKAGLKPYSASTRRYLHCPACVDAHGDSDFYVFSLKSSDPEGLKDRWHLIRGFGQLGKDQNHSNGLPCVGCNHHQACFGPEERVSSRIAPVCFYPFYMLILEAMSLNAPDFLALLSGASVQEVEDHLTKIKARGRLHCVRRMEEKRLPEGRFCSEDDSRNFPEILYLKLCLLGELFREISVKLRNCPHPDLKLSLDAVWIKLADQGRLLPFLWNFRVKYVGLGRDALKTAFLPKHPSSQGLHFMGFFWFYALLVNRRLTVSEVYSKLAEALEKMEGGEEGIFETISDTEQGPLFSPENIFWDPQNRQVSGAWESIWKQSLRLGWSLLETSLRSSGWSEETFWQSFDKLLDDVKKGLFPSDIDVSEKRPLGADHEAIHSILSRISENWRANVSTDLTPPEQEDGTKEKLEDTIVPMEDSKERLGLHVEELVDEEDERETLILRSQPVKKAVAADPGGQKNIDHGDPLSEDTFPRPIAPPGGALKSAASQHPGDQQWQSNHLPAGETATGSVDGNRGIGSALDDMAETVILTPKPTPSGGPKSARHQRPEGQQPPRNQGALGETILGGPEAKREETSVEDDIAETLILSPNKIKSNRQRDG